LYATIMHHVLYACAATIVSLVQRKKLFARTLSSLNIEKI